jgi:hypothetical protein
VSSFFIAFNRTFDVGFRQTFVCYSYCTHALTA